MKKTEQEFEETRLYEETKHKAIEKGSRFVDVSIHAIHELENRVAHLNDAKTCLEANSHYLLFIQCTSRRI